jgi:hypothetical protein
MTPVEHQSLCAVDRLLRSSQRVTAKGTAALVGKSEKQIRRYLARFTAQGLLSYHPYWLRLLTPLGIAAIQRGADELPRGKGQRPADAFTRPMFELLLTVAREPEPAIAPKVQKNPYLQFVRLPSVLDALQRKGLVEVQRLEGTKRWAPTKAGIDYLQAFAAHQHPWWKESA